MAGYKVPVDGKGNFVAEEILPEGMHTVEVAVLDKFGNGELFLRDLELEKSDWFAVGIADMTVTANKTKGPAKELNDGNTLVGTGRSAKRVDKINTSGHSGECGYTRRPLEGDLFQFYGQIS